MTRTSRSITLFALVSLSLGAALFALRATAQAQEKQPSPPPAASKEEESATIKDDPTVAPDPKQSADNNISFPVDI